MGCTSSRDSAEQRSGSRVYQVRPAAPSPESPLAPTAPPPTDVYQRPPSEVTPERPQLPGQVPYAEDSHQPAAAPVAGLPPPPPPHLNPEPTGLPNSLLPALTPEPDSHARHHSSSSSAAPSTTAAPITAAADGLPLSAGNPPATAAQDTSEGAPKLTAEELRQVTSALEEFLQGILGQTQAAMRASAEPGASSTGVLFEALVGAMEG
eukprot:RCo035005